MILKGTASDLVTVIIGLVGRSISILGVSVGLVEVKFRVHES